MPNDADDLLTLYAQIEALRIMALRLGYSALEKILLMALLDIERRLNDPAGPEAFTPPRLRQ